MRIGILTYHYAHNYGAVLQCYALQNYLISLGHTVRVIGHKNPYICRDYKVFDLRRFRIKNPFTLIKRISHEISYYHIRKGRYKAFDYFINNLLIVCPIQEINNDPFDLIIVGSDQVWNYGLTKGFDPYYWGEFNHPPKTVLATYAVSMQDSWPKEIDYEIQKRISNFMNISVREENLALSLKRIVSDRDFKVVVDPTLLFSSDEWDKIAVKPLIKEPYLLLYQVDASPIAEGMALKISEERKLRILHLYAQPDKPHSSEVSKTSPQEFVGLFKYASFVVCSSFHGTVFSIIYRKSFYTVKVPGKSSRVESLLHLYGLDDYLLSFSIDKINDVDYSKVPADISEQSKLYIINDMIR